MIYLFLLVGALIVGIYYRRYLITIKGLYIERAFLGLFINFLKGGMAKTHKSAKKSKGKPADTDVKLLYSKAMVYYDRGELGKAEKLLVEIVESGAKFEDALHKL